MRKLILSFALMGIIMAAGLVAVWLWQLAPLSPYLRGEVPPGQAAYMSMRGLGLMSLLLLWSQLMLGLLFSVFRNSEEAGALVDFHKKIGLFAFGVVVSHPLFFLWGIFQRTAHFKGDNLLPAFNKGFYQASISIGVLALYVLAAGFVAGVCSWRRGRSPHGSWLTIHRINGAAFALAAFHSLLIGSETRFLAAALIVSVAAASLCVMLGARLRGKIKTRIRTPGRDLEPGNGVN